MFCTQCGTRNLDTDQFCRNCSAPLTRPRATARFPQGQSQTTHAQQPSQNLPPYPGYQGFPISHPGYNPPMSIQQNKASGQAIAAMVLSIFSLVSCCFPAGIVGMVIGKIELNAIREGRSSQAGETFAKLGFYLGIASTIFTGIVYFFGFLSKLAGL
ncbi:MAG: DUF4190 domain-containing protein [Blastocatellia bacterium]